MARLQENYQAYNWIRADHGESDAEVYRLVGEQTYYLKVGGSDLAAEAERLEWLAAQGMPVPHVVEAGADWLVTTEVAGVPAAELDQVVDAMASVARMLHALPVEACPYRRDLAVTTEQAHKQVSNGLVDLENLEDEYDGWTGEQLLERLTQSRPADEDLVVCHGDFTPENVLLDPQTGAVSWRTTSCWTSSSERSRNQRLWSNMQLLNNHKQSQAVARTGAESLSGAA
ncbi:hypothetical protein GCM10009745_22720 [Kribbella yunnanensis]|uniref:Aminoglycoside phosphotransferase domain-containing protein n=2 Tax=Kribbella yunnanensis TaxID=190194 RepID=A0ABN2GXN9_9ACTN